jgi:hypothetical protein
LISPSFLLMRESYGIKAPAPGHEHDLATSAQAVDSEKYLVPRQIGASTRDLFKVTGIGSSYDVDYLNFHGCRLCHAPSSKNGMSCWEESIALSVPVDNLV